jgi:hypothetical protein
MSYVWSPSRDCSVRAGSIRFPRRLSSTLLAEQKIPHHVMVVHAVDRGQKGRAAIAYCLLPEVWNFAPESS